MARHCEAKLTATPRPTSSGIQLWELPPPAQSRSLVYLNRLLAAGVRPNLVLVEVLPAMLADGHGGPVERHWFLADRLLAAERATVIRYGFDAAAVEHRWWRSVLTPSATLRFQLVSRVAPSWLPWHVRFDWSRGADDAGWGTTQSQEAGEAQLAKGTGQARAEYAPTLADYHPGGPAVAALGELLAVCRAHSVPVRLVLMPEGEEFRGWLPTAGNDRLRAALGAVTAGTGVGVTDARDWLPNGDFYDGHHMFARGAERFTGRLTDAVIVPLLRSPSPLSDGPPGDPRMDAATTAGRALSRPTRTRRPAQMPATSPVRAGRASRSRTAIVAGFALYAVSQLALIAAVRSGHVAAGDPAYAEKFTLLAAWPAQPQRRSCSCAGQQPDACGV